MPEMIDSRIERAHTVDIHVGARVRQRRKAIKISQVELAAKLGLTFQQVQKYERGMNRISASKLWETSKALGVPVAWFFEGYSGPEAVPAPANDVHAFLSTGEAIDLGEAFLALPSDSQRRRVLDLMKAMGG